MAGNEASFAIDIAAKMDGGEHTLAQLDALTAKLTASGKGADFFQTAIQKVSGELDVAKAANVAANDALKEGETRYRELERAADKAAKALEAAGKKEKGSVDINVARRARETAKALEEHASVLRELEGNAKRADDAEKHLGTTLGNLKKLSGHVDKSLAGASEETEKLRGAMAAAGGQVGALGSKLLAPVQGFQKLSAEMGASKAAAVLLGVGAAALAVSLVAVTAAAAAGVLSIAKWAVGLADANRSAALHREALEAMHPELVALHGTIDSVAKATGMHADELSELAGNLQEAGVSAGDMAGALEAAALAETALGKGGAADFVADVKAGKKAVAELSRDAKTKLGGIVEKQMRGLDAQSQRASESVSKIFGGLNIDPVLDAVDKLVGLLDESSASGRALHFLFNQLFQPLIDNSVDAAVAFEALVLKLEIAAVKAYIAVKKNWQGIKDEFKGLNDTLTALSPVFDTLLWPVRAAGAVLGAAASAFVSLGLVVGKTWLSILGIITGSDLFQMGVDLLAGLARGITSAAGAVKDAVHNAVTGAIDKAKSLLGIASPSKVFAEIGGYTAEGFTQGVDDGAGDAQSALANMVSPPSASDIGAPGVNGSAGASGAGGRSISLSNVTFQFNGVRDAEHAQASFKETLLRVLEGETA